MLGPHKNLFFSAIFILFPNIPGKKSAVSIKIKDWIDALQIPWDFFRPGAGLYASPYPTELFETLSQPGSLGVDMRSSQVLGYSFSLLLLKGHSQHAGY